MNHPTHEDWMSFLYDEDSPERHHTLETHLRACAACSARMNSWRAGAQALDDWALPVTGPVTVREPSWKWAAAAALVLGLGIAIGRFAGPPGADADALRAVLSHEFDQKIEKARADWIAEWHQSRSEPSTLMAAARETAGTETQRGLAEFLRDHEEQRLRDKKALFTTLREFDAKYVAGLALLRKELETVAVNTQEGFTETEQRLGQLASFKQPTELPAK